MPATMTLAELAGEALNDSSPDWVSVLVYEAHGNFLPDDWRYSCIRSALEFIHDNDADEDSSHEFADGEVDVYTNERFAWLSSSLRRADYVDQAVEDFGSNPEAGIVDQIGLGQYAEAQEVYASVISSLEDELNNRDDD
jgi:hypothetical protein